MVEFESNLEKKGLFFGDAITIFAREGFQLGDNWHYAGGHFDLLMEEGKENNLYLRIPFHTESGELDDIKAFIRIEKPFLICHAFQVDCEDNTENPLINSWGVSATLNQFQSPQDVDAPINNEIFWLKQSKKYLERIEKQLNS